MVEHLASKQAGGAPAPAEAPPAAEPAAPPAEEDAVAVTAARKSIAIAAAALAAPPPSKEMPAAAMRLLLARPKVPAPLDPNFSPVILGKKKYLAAAAGCADTLQWALPRADGCGRGGIPVFPEGTEDAEASIYLAGVLIQE